MPDYSPLETIIPCNGLEVHCRENYDICQRINFFTMKNINILLLLVSLFAISCATPSKTLPTPDTQNQRPNVILIMADDMGFECLSANGSESYSTPNLDRLAAKGIRFTKTISQPLCTPSRVKIMTGKYNYRNYDYFTYLNPKERTFGNMMKEAGYATCIVGKWQLNGLAHNLPGTTDNSRPHHFGFEEYCLWQMTKHRREGERFANPLLEQNGIVLPRNEDAYGPAVVSEYATSFIRRHKDQPFFLYYPMILVHDPFVPTPDSKEWADRTKRYKKNPAYFKDMVTYTDKIVGNIVDELERQGIADNTLLIFTGDNGTHYSITSQTKSGAIVGAKGNTIEAGTHVPMVAYWPAKIKQGQVYDGLIEFSDFYPTLADLVGATESVDGKSFYNLLLGKKHTDRTEVFVHYDPQWGKRVNAFRNQFAQTTRYKLYQDGKFYDLKTDKLEERPISESAMNKETKRIKAHLKAEIAKAPEWENSKE